MKNPREKNGLSLMETVISLFVTVFALLLFSAMLMTEKKAEYPPAERTMALCMARNTINERKKVPGGDLLKKGDNSSVTLSVFRDNSFHPVTFHINMISTEPVIGESSAEPVKVEVRWVFEEKDLQERNGEISVSGVIRK